MLQTKNIPHFSVSEWLLQLFETPYTFEEQGLIVVAWEHVTKLFNGKNRRDGSMVVGHCMRAAKYVQEIVPDLIDGVVATEEHDVIEDTLTTRRMIEKLFGPIHGPAIGFRVSALSRDPIYPESYYPGIVEAAKTYFDIPISKLADNRDNRLSPFMKSAEDELKNIEETLGPFHWMCRESRPIIAAARPEVLPRFDQGVEEVIHLAHSRREVLLRQLDP